MTHVNYAALREHHLQGARYENLRIEWFRRVGNAFAMELCKDLAREHANSAILAQTHLIGSEIAKRKRKCN
jgi:hypothetical protein